MKRGERGSAVVSALVLLSAAFLVVLGARLFGGAAALQLSCQGEAVQAIGSGSAARCGSRFHAGAGSPGTQRPQGTPPSDDGQTPEHQGARDLLAPLFDIVESGTEGAAENQVTEEQFEEVVSLYDDVREKRTYIQHNRRAAPYWDTIMADLALILQSEGGRELITRLAYRVRWTIISIAFVRNQDGEPDPDLGLDSSNAAAWYDGSDGYVEYAPGDPVELPSADPVNDPWAVMRSDVALYHELRHVLDLLAGTDEAGNIREDGVRVPAMEYQAIGLGEWRDRMMSENAYRAARRAIANLGIGAATGDADMPHRPRYRYQLPSAGDP